MHSITAGLLLTKLNTGSEYFTYSELRDCDDDSPFDARREINALLKEGFIREDGDRRYRITVDIYTLRKFVLKGDSDVKGPSETSMTYRFDSFKIVESVWHAANRVTETDRFDNKSDDEDEEEDRYELNRRRREYLEKRRQELIARLREELCESDDDDDDDEEEDPEDDDEDENSDFIKSSLFADEGEESEETKHEKLVKLISDESTNGKLLTSALKLCASEGYISSWLLCKNLNIDENKADFICLWLYMNDFTKSVENESDKYIMALSESLFFACCHEVEERKRSLTQLSTVIKRVQEKRQREEERERAELYRYMNDYQFRKVVRAKLIALVRTDLKMTRSKAITKAEGCLCAARDMGNDKAAAVYEKVIFEFNNMSDYMFNRLKSQYAD